MPVIKFTLKDEIRRISFDTQPTFGEVSELLKRLYGAKLPEAFVLQYLDSERDLVTVSSTEEIEEAFRNFSGRTISKFLVVPIIKLDEKLNDDDKVAEEMVKLFLGKLLGVPRPTSSPFAPRHCPRFSPHPQHSGKEEKVAHNASCDHCNSRIFGLRFKCTTCPDFDLCEKCLPSKNDKHNASHLFLRIPHPHCRPCVPKQEVAKTESFPFKIEVSVPSKTEEVAKPEESVIVTEPEPLLKEEVAKPEEKKEISPFETKLLQLEEMGFVDREKNVEALVKYYGDVAKALRDLLEASSF